MNTLLKEILFETRQKEVEKSVGFICTDCNQTAYYFKTKNVRLHSKKTCLICSKENENGIILEDFRYTLSRHVKNHYKLTKNDASPTISLKDVLKRFTYDNEQVLENLANLLCQENGNFFQIDGLYKSTVDEVFIKECKAEAIEKWNKFAKELKHSRRYHHTEAYQFYESLIDACVYKIEENENDKSGSSEPNRFNSALTKIKKDTVFYRGRLVKNDNEKRIISSNPETELSAPPEYLASNSRMSPSGIPFMYTADKPETAIAEIHPYVNDIIAIGTFVSTKELNFFDFTLLNKLLHNDYNILENPNDDNNIKNRYLLDSLHEIISRPLRATDTSYIETQMFAEAIRHYKNSFFDGIIFGSSQLDGGLNYVLFGESLEDGDSNNPIKQYPVKLNSKQEIEFYRVLKMEASTKKLD